MAAYETISKVKDDLRITTTKLDMDISHQIDECVKDLTICGAIGTLTEADTGIFAAIRLWCRSHYADDTTEMMAFKSRYDQYKGTLMMADGYGGATSVT